MLLRIQNDKLCLTVSTLGAQMMSLRSCEGIEYLWQGDPAYWPDRAPVLFPFIARLTNNRYRYRGKLYPMEIHGFANKMEFSPVEHGPEHLVLELKSTIVTVVRYPFDFTLRIRFSLERNRLCISFEVENQSDRYMPFGIGGHPGFRVPLLPDEQFTDYELEFTTPCQPDRVGFTEKLFLSGQDTPYPLLDGRRIDLHHGLFDEDAIVLKNMGREITLRSKLSHRGVCVSYPDMPYLGLWHAPKTDAPYVCIEPWSSLPSRQDVVEEFSCKSDMIQLAPRCTYRSAWSITAF